MGKCAIKLVTDRPFQTFISLLSLLFPREAKCPFSRFLAPDIREGYYTRVIHWILLGFLSPRTDVSQIYRVSEREIVDIEISVQTLPNLRGYEVDSGIWLAAVPSCADEYCNVQFGEIDIARLLASYELSGITFPKLYTVAPAETIQTA